ncbi:MAG TPA: DUF2924 domain-containing protein [Polyangiaceae bacterium]|jgi:hypothetical protein|nr:DUF2924 domain-containing protein [Polyangiaceae bacterium]
MTQSRSDLAVVDAEIGQVRSLDIDALRREWRRMYHSEPPQLSRDLLALALAYKIQELQHGALGKSTRRKLQTMAKSLRATGRIAPGLSISLKPGARLVREWRGRAHTVTVTEEGFEYGGGDYPSLTKIAEKITGTKWSGPRFFGLLAPNGKRQNIGANNG